MIIYENTFEIVDFNNKKVIISKSFNGSSIIDAYLDINNSYIRYSIMTSKTIEHYEDNTVVSILTAKYLFLYF